MKNFKGIPQIIVIVSMAASLGVVLAKNGEPRGNYNLLVTFIATIIDFGLLAWGGFFNCFKNEKINEIKNNAVIKTVGKMNRENLTKVSKLVDQIDYLTLILQSSKIRLSESRDDGEENCQVFRFSVVISKEIIEPVITEYINKLKIELKELGYEDI
jgi:hypothetical protein